MSCSKQVHFGCGSSVPPGDVGGDEVRLGLEPLERGGERPVPFLDGLVAAVVGGELPGCLPDALDWHELGRVRRQRQPVELDLVGVGLQPGLALVVEPVAGAVVHDEEDLPRRVLGDELQQELVEGVAVEDVRESVGEGGAVEADGPEDVGGLAESVGVDPGLYADRRPRLMKSAVQPEAGLVLENYDSSAAGRFF